MSQAGLPGQDQGHLAPLRRETKISAGETKWEQKTELERLMCSAHTKKKKESRNQVILPTKTRDVIKKNEELNIRKHFPPLQHLRAYLIGEDLGLRFRHINTNLCSSCCLRESTVGKETTAVTCCAKIQNAVL